MSSEESCSKVIEKPEFNVNLDQVAEHLKSGDPNKTVLLQGSDGKTQVIVNNDENSIRNYFAGGKSFEDIGDADDIQFELGFRLHKDSTAVITAAGGSLSSAVPAISYHNHVWWYWSYDLAFTSVDGVIKASFTLKSIGPSITPNRPLPRGALGENIPRNQVAPILKNPVVHIDKKSFKLKPALGGSDITYSVDDFVTLNELNAYFTPESLFLTINVSFVIPKAYFNVTKLAECEKPSTDVVPKNVEVNLGKILKGEKVAGSDFVLTFGDSSKNDSVEYHVHRAALARTSPLLGQLFVQKVNPPGDQILVPTAEDRFIFPHLRPEDAPFFLTYLYTQRITLPHFAGFARLGRVFCMIAERTSVMHLFKEWQRLLVENLLDAEKSEDSNLVIEEAVKALISIYSAPYGSLPVAKRVAASLLANEISLAGAESKNLIATLRDHPTFKNYDLEKFLPGVVRLQLLISATKKRGI